jgi:hypothetical protein
MPRPRKNGFLFIAGWLVLSLAFCVAGWMMFASEDNSVRVVGSGGGLAVRTAHSTGLVLLGCGALSAIALAGYSIMSIREGFSPKKKRRKLGRPASEESAEDPGTSARRCPGCKRRIPPDALRCRHCGAAVKPCPRCGELLPGYATACGYCKAILESR